MSKEIPTVQKYMIYNPITIESSASLSEAQNVMNQNQIRHLPVLEKGHFYGILSDRDIKLAMSLIKSDEHTKIKHICNNHVYTTDPDTHIDIVAETMANNHYGCTVVIQNTKVVGIFTTSDACRALCDITHKRFHT